MGRRKRLPPGWEQMVLGEENGELRVDVSQGRSILLPVTEPTPTKTDPPKPNRVDWIRRRERELVDGGMTHDQALDIITREIEQQEEAQR